MMSLPDEAWDRIVGDECFEYDPTAGRYVKHIRPGSSDDVPGTLPDGRIAPKSKQAYAAALDHIHAQMAAEAGIKTKDDSIVDRYAHRIDEEMGIGWAGRQRVTAILREMLVEHEASKVWIQPDYDADGRMTQAVDVERGALPPGVTGAAEQTIFGTSRDAERALVDDGDFSAQIFGQPRAVDASLPPVTIADIKRLTGKLEKAPPPAIRSWDHLSAALGLPPSPTPPIGQYARDRACYGCENDRSYLHRSDCPAANGTDVAVDGEAAAPMACQTCGPRPWKTAPPLDSRDKNCPNCGRKDLVKA